MSSLTPSVVLVEDNARLLDALSRGLREDGFDVATAASGAAGMQCLFERPRDVAVLDLGLPDLDGLELLRRVRDSGFLAPILILSARDTVASRVEGLEAGADDYLVKPFAYPELLARLRVLVRRTRWTGRHVPRVPDVVLSGEPQGLLLDGRAVALSPRELALLELLLQRRGEAVARAEILRDVFGYSFDPGTNVVDVHIAHLRRKLGAAAVLVQTVRGFGYRLRQSDADA